MINEKTITLYEIFQKAAESNDPLSVLKAHSAKDVRIMQVLAYAMNPKWKMNLPDGTPPYIPTEMPLGLAEVEILNLGSKIYVLYDPKMPQIKKEVMLIQWMEKMAPQEAEMMIHIKDKTLHTIYPDKLTEAVLVAFMGWPMEDYLKLKQAA